MKVELSIKATFNISEGDLAALKKAKPEDQLMTAKLAGGNVKSSINPAMSRKPRVTKADVTPPAPPAVVK